MSRGKPQDILPRRPGETDRERRFRETINLHCGKAVATLDEFIQLRTADSAPARARHIARGHIVDFAIKALYAYSLTVAVDDKTGETDEAPEGLQARTHRA
jgi:hypothetical protein